MAKEKTYYEQTNIRNIKRLRELISEFPKFTQIFFRGIEQTTVSSTRIAYALDLKVFFDYIQTTNPLYQNLSISEIDLELLSRLKAQDIEEYMEYLKLYHAKDGKELMNEERAIKRKLSSLRAFYKYYHRNKMIEENPVLQTDLPKLHDKAIVRFDTNEMMAFLDTVESGASLTKRQKQFHKKNKVRDLALMTLLLGTGLRVSECVGLDCNDLDFNNDRMKVVRKGGYESYVYFGEEVKEALLSYLIERKEIPAVVGHEKAFFLSSRKQRISVRNIEIMVKKYAMSVTSTKQITPHKLRSTYGTNLYQETGDIYLVADVLGHKDVNTTRKHYAALEEERKKLVKDVVKLRTP